jgi:hypothetical protein
VRLVSRLQKIVDIELSKHVPARRSSMRRIVPVEEGPPDAKRASTSVLKALTVYAPG